MLQEVEEWMCDGERSGKKCWSNKSSSKCNHNKSRGVIDKAGWAWSCKQYDHRSLLVHHKPSITPSPGQHCSVCRSRIHLKSIGKESRVSLCIIWPWGLDRTDPGLVWTWENFIHSCSGPDEGDRGSSSCDPISWSPLMISPVNLSPVWQIVPGYSHSDLFSLLEVTRTLDGGDGTENNI